MQIKRNWWLFKKAALTPREFFLISINKIIYWATQFFYYWQGRLVYGEAKIVYGRGRYLPAGIKAKKRALISYLRDPLYREHFIGGMKYYWSNNGAPLALYRAVNELGYIVDVMHVDAQGVKLKKKYDLFVFHDFYNFDEISPQLDPSVPKVFFDTVAYWRFVTEQMEKRFIGFQARHGIALPRAEFNPFLRLVDQAQKADRIIKSADSRIIIGDQLAKSYDGFGAVYKTTNGCLPDVRFKKDLSARNLEAGRGNFLFFGGGRDNIRKGLDVLLDAFIGSPHHLYFCSELHPALERIYRVARHKNLHPLGYLKQGSKRFYEIINLCDFVIQPSCAEGIPGGVLDCLKYGLIPVVSRECNIAPRDFGVLIDAAASVAAVRSVMDFVSSQPPEWLGQRAEKAIQAAETVYSPRAFMEDFKAGIMIAVNKKK